MRDDRLVRVLVVEDDVRMAALLRRGLEEDGYAVDTTGDGVEAIWLAQENPYDAIMLDIMLLGADGFDVCRQLRAAGEWAPVIMLTARDEVTSRVRGLDAGADDYLTKPFAYAELAARLRALIRRGAHERPPVLTVGDLRADPASRRAWRRDHEIALAPKEFALLEMFLRHPDEVLSRTRILNHLWDFAFEANSNIVDQYVRYLRRKIDRPFGRADLRTIRGSGYMLRSTPEVPPEQGEVDPDAD